ncbi:MAG: UPF0149 family protein [Gammaproteobacteria bacterium]|jgi:uncharacterized protein
MTDYRTLQTVLERSQAELGAAEAHGMLTAQLVVNGETGLADWVRVSLPQLDEADVLVRELLGVMRQVFQETRAQLLDEDVSFSPLLPVDEAPMAQRVEALAAWSQGFLTGLGLAGLSAAALDQDSRGFLHDLEQFTRAGADEAEESEVEEANYMELCEYLRLGVLMMRDTFRPPTPGETLH